MGRETRVREDDERPYPDTQYPKMANPAGACVPKFVQRQMNVVDHGRGDDVPVKNRNALRCQTSNRNTEEPDLSPTHFLGREQTVAIAQQMIVCELLWPTATGLVSSTLMTKSSCTALPFRSWANRRSNRNSHRSHRTHEARFRDPALRLRCNTFQCRTVLRAD